MTGDFGMLAYAHSKAIDTHKTIIKTLKKKQTHNSADQTALWTLLIV